VPFHFYAPDVYQGTTHPNAALLSIVPKAAGFVALVRILVLAMPGLEPYTWRIVLAVSVLTMIFGNVMALWQDDLRRLLAYSSIAQSGYMLLALAAALAARDCPNFHGRQSATMVGENGTVPFATALGAWDGIGALGFYFVAYALATLGAFAVFERLGRPERSLDAVDELAGLGRTRPLAAGVLAVFMFSLAGIPPLAGFLGKLLVFGGALNIDAQAGAAGNLQGWFVGAAILGVLNSAVAAAYYLRIVAVMYFRTPLATPQAQGGAGAWWAAAACALLLIGIWFYPGPLLRETGNASFPETGTRNEAATPVCPAAWSGGDYHKTDVSGLILSGGP
jgi:NADH-quinone oxidoreductase subunit N